MFDVPYDEPPGRNPHHVLYNISKESFSEFPDPEIFYQDALGFAYHVTNKPSKPNIIMCVCTQPDLIKISESSIRFPVAPWKPQYSSFRKACDQTKLLLRRVIKKMKLILRDRNR